MKVAVVHDYFTTYAGAERVTREILGIFPEADVFTLIDRMEGDREFLSGHRVSSSFLNRLPWIQYYYRNLFFLFAAAIERFDLSKYDLIISSSHSAAKGIKVNARQLHVCYCHSPARWAWDLKEQYMREAGLDKGLKGRVAGRLIERFRRWDAMTADNVDHFVSNSDYVAQRIRHAYGRQAMTIYPPVDTDTFQLCETKDEHYIIVSRFVWYKKVRAAVEAFNRMPDRRLIVVGGGPQESELKKIASPNVEVLGRVPHEVLVSLVEKAKAMIFTAEEDFGIAPVEAQACGTPVIAYGVGGARETVMPDRTGVWFQEQSALAVCEAVERFETMDFDPAAVRKNALRFSSSRFRSEFKGFIDQVSFDAGAPSNRQKRRV